MLIILVSFKDNFFFEDCTNKIFLTTLCYLNVLLNIVVYCTITYSIFLILARIFQKKYL